MRRTGARIRGARKTGTAARSADAGDQRDRVCHWPTGRYDHFVYRGYDAAYTDCDDLWPANRSYNLQAQQYGSWRTGRTFTMQHCGESAIHNNNGVDGCTYTITDGASITLDPDGSGSGSPHDQLLLPSMSGTQRAITAVDEAKNTITISATGGCPNVPIGSPVDYALFDNADNPSVYERHG